MKRVLQGILSRPHVAVRSFFDADRRSFSLSAKSDLPPPFAGAPLKTKTAIATDRCNAPSPHPLPNARQPAIVGDGAPGRKNLPPMRDFTNLSVHSPEAIGGAPARGKRRNRMELRNQPTTARPRQVGLNFSQSSGRERGRNLSLTRRPQRLGSLRWLRFAPAAANRPLSQSHLVPCTTSIDLRPRKTGDRLGGRRLFDRVGEHPRNLVHGVAA